MKALSITTTTLLLAFLFAGGVAASDVTGDINGDGVVDLAEAVYALQVAAGLQPEPSGSGSGCEFPAPVPDTGQTTQYHAGDDGDPSREGGVALPQPRFTDNGNGTILDNLTGLIWLKDAFVMGARTWEAAFGRVGDLNSGSVTTAYQYTAGTHNDWRLPTVNELESLRNLQYYQPAMSNRAGTGQALAPPVGTDDPFHNLYSILFWTSTTAVGTPNPSAYAFSSQDGSMLPKEKVSNLFILPVRGPE